MAQPTDPAMWWQIVAKHRDSTEGGAPSGAWSVRKLVLAKIEYKERGGGWVENPPHLEQERLAEKAKRRQQAEGTDAEPDTREIPRPENRRCGVGASSVSVGFHGEDGL